MLKKVQIKTVHTAPAIGKVEMMSGIRTRQEAEHWAEKKGYSVVYWLENRQRVYADRLTKDVAALAKQVETKSGRLLELSEQGGGALGDLALVAGVVAVIVILGRCGVPW